MRNTYFLLLLLVATCTASHAQDVSEINKPIELLNAANTDIENGEYEAAVQKLIASIRLNPKLRDAYLSLNTACSYTNQTDILKSHLLQAKKIFLEDDELCYYLGNLYQNADNYTAAIREYSAAIQYAKTNGEDFELVYAYYLNRANCYLKLKQFEKAIPDFDHAQRFEPENGAIYNNRGIAYFQIGKRQEAYNDWKKASALGIASAKNYLKRYYR